MVANSFLNTSINAVKNPAKNPPSNKDFNLLTLSLSNGRIGQSITCINGVSLRRETFESYKLATNCVKIAVFACTSICLFFVGETLMLKAGFKL